ncbi:EAL/GGDEF domain-containing protein [Caballeronia udeis]|uniref:EAL/GGDEF domain-containing protein n=2 Tax=Caballeronia udeis TaxID=1232866 RepID=A0A158JA37_9BURK|nr:EAL/GGDEF domain-containing protein [Caballeronia udeis]
MPEPDPLVSDLAPEGDGEREHSSDTLMATRPRHPNGRDKRQTGKQTRRDRLPPGLHLAMQPIMSITAPSESLDFEVLLRVRAPDGSVQAANKLIATAEQSGDIAAIDTWVMTTVLEWFREHRMALINTRFICVNLSASSINDAHFLEETFSLFVRFQDVVPYLCLQISESVALNNLAGTQHFISRVHHMGGKIALDNFGSGYSSFKYVRHLSTDVLKIDDELVRTMHAHPTDIAIVEAMVMLARNLGMRSIASQVENINTLRVLTELGVDYVQGFLVARPQEAMAILGASSTTSFVEDPAVAKFVQDMGNTDKQSTPALASKQKSQLH